jgi:hypothetical protein
LLQYNSKVAHKTKIKKKTMGMELKGLFQKICGINILIKLDILDTLGATINSA